MAGYVKFDPEMGILFGKLNKMEVTIARIEALVCDLVNRDVALGIITQSKNDHQELYLEFKNRYRSEVKAEHKLKINKTKKGKKEIVGNQKTLFDWGLLDKTDEIPF